MSDVNEQCPWIDRVDAYVDQRLSSEEHDAMARHVAGCAACMERVRQTEAVREAVAAFPAQRLSEAALGRLHDAVAEAWDRGLTRWAWGLTGLAAAVLVAAATWFATLPAEIPSVSQPGWRQVART